jgi:hypothetical protein
LIIDTQRKKVVVNVRSATCSPSDRFGALIVRSWPKADDSHGSISWSDCQGSHVPPILSRPCIQTSMRHTSDSAKSVGRGDNEPKTNV